MVKERCCVSWMVVKEMLRWKNLRIENATFEGKLHLEIKPSKKNTRKKVMSKRKSVLVAQGKGNSWIGEEVLYVVSCKH